MLFVRAVAAFFDLVTSNKLAAFITIVSAVLAVNIWIASQPSSEESAEWSRLILSNDCNDYRAFIRAYPDSKFSSQARSFLAAADANHSLSHESFSQRYSIIGQSGLGEMKQREQACEAAKSDAKKYADEFCGEIAVHNGSIELSVVSLALSCECSDLDGISGSVWSCAAEGFATCSGKIPVSREVEVCGPAR